MMTGERKIIHVDMDCFFAACEVRENPELRGKPIAVGFDGPRGVVSTASYEARRFGVHSAMAMSTAKRKCPQLIVVPSHFELYKSVSKQIHDIFHQYTDIIEPISLDEAFLDVTVNKPGIAMARDIAIEIKQKIFDATGLTASAGISYNKFLAKIASDWRKPNGLTIIHPLRAEEFIAALPVEKFWGVGEKTAEKMHSLGIFTGEHLRACPLPTLVKHFGKAGRIFYDFSRGVDNRPVVVERIRKSVGCEETFLSDIHEQADIDRELGKLLDELLRRQQRHQFEGRTLVLKVKFFDFTQITRSITVEHPLSARHQFLPLIAELLSQVDYSPARPIRLLGLTLAHTNSSSNSLTNSSDPQFSHSISPSSPYHHPYAARIHFPDLFDEEYDEWY